MLVPLLTKYAYIFINTRGIIYYHSSNYLSQYQLYSVCISLTHLCYRVIVNLLQSLQAELF